MDRRMFLGSVGALALTPILKIEASEASKQWKLEGLTLACNLSNRFNKSPRYYPEIHVFYDTVEWRGMRHNWIAYCENAAVEYGYPIENMSSFKLMCMDYSVVDYPNKEHWDDLRHYGHTLAIIAQKHLHEWGNLPIEKGNIC